jgi:hypothetical protein
MCIPGWRLKGRGEVEPEKPEIRKRKKTEPGDSVAIFWKICNPPTRSFITDFHAKEARGPFYKFFFPRKFLLEKSFLFWGVGPK